MSKIHKISLLLLLLAVFLFVYILVSAKKIDTKKAQLESMQDKITEEVDDRKIIPVPGKIQEERYAKNIDKITREYQSFIDLLNQRTKTERLDSETVYTIFTADDTAIVELIEENLKNTLVPGKYKEFHLLLSRSLLKLSSYINTSNPKDMLAGLELFEQARKEYSRFDIG